MARPRKQGLDYFPHDTAASSDEKLLLCEALHKNDAYAVFFKLLEGAHRQRAGELDLSALDMRALFARRCNLELEAFEQVVNTAVSKGLFEAEAWTRGVITSERIRKNLAAVQRHRVSGAETGVSDAETGVSFSSSSDQDLSIYKRREKETRRKPPVSALETIVSELETLVSAGETRTAALIKLAGEHKALIEDRILWPSVLDTAEARGAWLVWLAYKHKRGELYKHRMSEQAALAEHAPMGSARFVAAIMHSISREWQGIFEPKANGNGKAPPAAAPTRVQPKPAKMTWEDKDFKPGTETPEERQKLLGKVLKRKEKAEAASV